MVGSGRGEGREGTEVARIHGDLRDWIARRRVSGLLLGGGEQPADPAEAVGRLTAMQAQEHPYARWSVAQRTSGSLAAPAIDSAFDEGRILRTHVLRPTWHYVSPADLRWLMRLSGPRVNAGNARRYADLGLDGPALARAGDVIAQEVADGPRTRRELAAALGARGISAEGQRIAHMLMHAELEMVICSGPMRGKQHTYAPFDQRVPDGPGRRGDEALAELAWRYFSTRGPATLTDFIWWSGIRAADARRGLEMVRPRLSCHEADRRQYWFADHGTPRSARRADLVQCYDELIISYSQTRDVLQTDSVAFPVPRHIDGFWHVLLLDGRLLGHWRQRAGRDGIEIETRTGRPLGGAEQDALADATGRYRRFSQAR
jgi:Winged helix DNA-binding domain